MSRRGPAAHERRVSRRLDARGDPGLGEALTRLDGSLVGGRFRIESLYAVGSEGAVFQTRDLTDPSAPMRVAKVALHPLHRPFDLTEEAIVIRRESLREEAANLAGADSAFMPRCFGLFEFPNPALESDWGGEFGEPEPCLVMERLPGFDLDLWLARMHSSRVPRALLRRQLDHVAIVVLSALMDLHDRGYYYTDLRPGNVRIRGRSKQRVRLMDAGSLVRTDDRSGKFPHVPAYLPPELFEQSREGGPLTATPAIQAVMAGRTLFEVATGRVPLPGEPVETAALYGLNVSPSVAETIERLCRGSFPDVTEALAYLSQNFSQGADDRQKRAAPASSPAQTAVPRPAAERAPPPVKPARSLGPKPVMDLHSALATARSGGGAAATRNGPSSSPEAEAPPQPAPVPVPRIAAKAQRPVVVSTLDEDLLFETGEPQIGPRETAPTRTVAAARAAAASSDDAPRSAPVGRAASPRSGPVAAPQSGPVARPAAESRPAAGRTSQVRPAPSAAPAPRPEPVADLPPAVSHGSHERAAPEPQIPAPAAPAEPVRRVAADVIAEHIARQETQAIEPELVAAIAGAASEGRLRDAFAPVPADILARGADRETPKAARSVAPSLPATSVPLAQAFALVSKPAVRPAQPAAPRPSRIRTPTQRNLDVLAHRTEGTGEVDLASLPASTPPSSTPVAARSAPHAGPATGAVSRPAGAPASQQVSQAISAAVSKAAGVRSPTSRSLGPRTGAVAEAPSRPAAAQIPYFEDDVPTLTDPMDSSQSLAHAASRVHDEQDVLPPSPSRGFWRRAWDVVLAMFRRG